MQERVSKLEDRVMGLETRVAVAESNIKDIKEDLTSIKNNTSWILKIVVGAIITGLLGLMIKGGTFI